MAKSQKRGKLNRLASPASTSRAPALGSISQPVNTAFRVSYGGPKLNPVSDLSALSATVAKGLQLEAETQSQDTRAQDLTLGQQWVVDNPDLIRGLTTQAKAIEDGIIPASSTPEFWEGLQRGVGLMTLNNFTDVGGPLEDLYERMSSPDRGNADPGAEFFQLWQEHISTPLAGNYFALQVANAEEFANTRSKFLARVNKDYSESSELQARTNARHNTATRISQIYEGIEGTTGAAAFDRTTWRGLAEGVSVVWRQGQLGPASDSAQADQIAASLFLALDRIVAVAEYPGASHSEKVEALERALELAQSAQGEGTAENRGAVWGDSSRGFTPVFSGGLHETAMNERIADYVNKIDVLNLKVSTEWSAQGGTQDRVRQVAQQRLAPHLSNLHQEDPTRLTDVYREVAGLPTSPTHEHYAGIFGDAWDQEFTDTILEHPNGPGEFLTTLQGFIGTLQEAPSKALDEFQAELSGLVDQEMFGAALALINNSNIPDSVRTAAISRINTAADASKWVAGPGFAQFTASLEAEKARLEKQGYKLSGESLDLYFEGLQEYNSKAREFVESVLSDPEQAGLEWNNDSLGRLWRDSPIPDEISGRLTELLQSNAATQRENGERLINQAKSGQGITEDLDTLLNTGQLSLRDFTEIQGLLSDGSNAAQFKDKAIEALTEKLTAYFGANKEDGEISATLLQPAKSKVEQALEEQFDAWVQERIEQGDRWSVDAAREWLQAEEDKLLEIGVHHLEGIVSEGDAAVSDASTTPASAASQEVTPASRQATRTALTLSDGDNLGTIKSASTVYENWISKEAGDEAEDPENDLLVSLLFPTANLENLPGYRFADDIEDVLQVAAARLRDPATQPEELEYRHMPENSDGVPVPKPGLSSPQAGFGALSMRAAPVGESAYWASTNTLSAIGSSRFSFRDYLEVDSNVVTEFLQGLITPDLVSVRNLGRPASEVDPDEPIGRRQWFVQPLSPEAQQRITSGDASIFLDFASDASLAHSGEFIRPYSMVRTSIPFKGDNFEIGKESLKAAAGALDSQLGATRTLKFHGVMGQSGGPREPRPERHFERRQGNGFEYAETLIADQQVKLLQSGEEGAVQAAQALMAFRDIPVDWVLNGEAPISTTVYGKAEVNASPLVQDRLGNDVRVPSWSTNYPFAGADRALQRVQKIDAREGRSTPSDVINLQASITTTYTLPFKESDGTPLEWLDYNLTRNFGSMSQLEAVLNDPNEYDEETQSFVPGGKYYRYLQAFDVEVTATSTWSYLKNQAELTDMHDITTDQLDVARFRQTYRQLRGNR